MDILLTLTLHLVLITGFLVLDAALIWVSWWSIGRIIKLTGYWKIFYRAIMIAGRQIADEKAAKRHKK